MNLKLLCSLYVIGLIASLDGAVMFTDSMESPAVTGLSASAIPSGWLQSAQGFGSGDQGLADEDLGTFTTPYGSQALEAHFATNAGWTTAAGVIGSMVEGVMYTLTLNVAAQTSGSVTVALLAFNILQTTRDDVRGNPPTANAATLLNSQTLTVNTNNMSQIMTINYTAVAADVGKDLAIRLRSNNTTALYFDNFQVVNNVIPEPVTSLLGAIGCLLLLRRRRT